jgi:primosomal protein N' (replication factor Y)
VVAAAAHDYAQFYVAELAEREELGYPPHGRLIAVRIDGKNPHEVAALAQRIGNAAQAAAQGGAVEVLGPAPAPLERLKGLYRVQLLLRSDSREALAEAGERLRALPEPPRLDRDPQSLL